MAIKKTIFLCLITFTIALHETLLYGQDTSLLLKRIDKSDEFLAMNNSVMEVDTSELAIFSFEEGRTVPFQRKFVNTEDSKTDLAKN